jgi:hypothetical protein
MTDGDREFPDIRPEVHSLMHAAGYSPILDGSNGWIWIHALEDGTTLDRGALRTGKRLRERGYRMDPLRGAQGRDAAAKSVRPERQTGPGMPSHDRPCGIGGSSPGLMI